MKIEYIQKCKCGAVTIRFDNSASNSMFWETFEKLDLDTGDATWLHQSYCCDHCVNHWGPGRRVVRGLLQWPHGNWQQAHRRHGSDGN